MHPPDKPDPSLGQVQRELEYVMGKLDSLSAQVQRNTSVTQSVSALIQNLAQVIKDNADDPAALQALADQLSANDDSLAAAVVANTPVTPAQAAATTPN